MGQKIGRCDIHCYSTLPLLIAAAEDDAPVVETLLAFGADCNAEGPYGNTAFTEAVRTGKVENMEVLYRHGADIHKTLGVGYTPLMHAVMCSHPHGVEWLLAHGADWKAQVNQHETALAMAKRANDARIIRLLKQAGARE